MSLGPPVGPGVQLVCSEPSLAGEASRGVVEALGQTLGALGGLVLEAGGHRARDGQELGLDAPPDAAAPALELCLQASDRPLQARDRVALTRLPPVRELDDLTHGAIVEPPTDISLEPVRTAQWRRGYGGY